MKVLFKEIEYKSPEWEKAVRLREKILRAPLGSFFSDQELDEEKHHFQIAGFLENTLVATTVLVPEGSKMKMQRVVVSERFRNLNIGSEMMQFCEYFTFDKKLEEIYCHARDSAVNFHLKNSYNQAGDYFEEDGIPDLKMWKKLSSQSRTQEM
jgi:predicted GNAT family N-acyltransferase